MSTDNYAKYISEQVRKEKVHGFTNVAINEDVELTTEEFDDIVEAVIDALAEEIQDLQELSPELKARYVKKAGSQLFKAAYRAARDQPGEHKKNDAPAFTSHVKGHKDVKTIDKREAGINNATRKGWSPGTGIKYAGFEAGHDINTQRRHKVADHIDKAKMRRDQALHNLKTSK